jgi:hypothetical protein
MITRRYDESGNGTLALLPALKSSRQTAHDVASLIDLTARLSLASLLAGGGPAKYSLHLRQISSKQSSSGPSLPTSKPPNPAATNDNSRSASTSVRSELRLNPSDSACISQPATQQWHSAVSR